MLHEPAKPVKDDPSSSYKAAVGVFMFIGYALIYGGFVAINVANPTVMERIVFAGLNLAVVYGIGLIVFALILAVIYNHMCTAKEKELNKLSGQNKEVKA